MKKTLIGFALALTASLLLSPLASAQSALDGVRSVYVIGYGYYLTNKTSAQSAIDAVTYVSQVGTLGIIDKNTVTFHISQLGQLYNLITIDVEELLNKSSDRALTLSDHILALTSSEQMLLTNMQQISARIDEMKTLYNAENSAASQNEKKYFDSMKVFSAQEAYDYLEAYIRHQKDAIEYRSQVRALDGILTLYKKLVPRFDLKIRTLDANRDAILKSSYVVQIKSMQEKLIFSEREWKEITGE